MVVILDSEDRLKHVLQDLEKLRPKSVVMEHLIKNTLSKKYGWPGVEYVVDSYPDWNACICRPAYGSKDYVNRVSKNSLSVFSTKPEGLKALLDEPGVIQWNHPAHFLAVPKPDMYNVCRAKSEQISPVLVWGGYENARVFMMKPDKLIKRELPPGPFRLGEMRGAEHAELVHERWDWSDDESHPYVHYLLSDQCQLPNSAVFDTETNVPIAQILYTGDGSIGLGWVDPNYRNKGLYQIVIYDLCQKIYKMGYDVAWGYVQEDNAASTRAFLKLGAEECDYRIDWLTSGTPAPSV